MHLQEGEESTSPSSPAISQNGNKNMSYQKNGNLYSWIKKHPKNRNWFIGSSSFIKEKLFQSDSVEVKWNVKKKGWKHTRPQKNPKKTITILISGKLKISFPKTKKSVTLSKPGDFSFHESNIQHISEVIENCTTITIRFI